MISDLFITSNLLIKKKFIINLKSLAREIMIEFMNRVPCIFTSSLGTLRNGKEKIRVREMTGNRDS